MNEQSRSADANGPLPKSDNGAPQVSQDQWIYGSQGEPQDFAANDLVFDDEQLREMLWQDNGILAPANMDDGGWWSGSYMELTGHTSLFDP